MTSVGIVARLGTGPTNADQEVDAATATVEGGEAEVAQETAGADLRK